MATKMDVVIIGGKHYMNYGFSILTKCHDYGYCTIIVDLNKVWTNRFNGTRVKVSENFLKVLDLVTKVKVKIVRREIIDNGLREKVIVEW